MNRLLKSAFTIRRHVSAGDNAVPGRLLMQGLPYLLGWNGFSFLPLSLFFIINSRCNMKCQMCDVGRRYEDSMFYKNLVGTGADGRGDFPIERFETLMDEVRAFRPFVSITSTEPLLYEPLPRAISAAKSRGLGVNVTTNGLLLSRRHGELLESGLDRLTVSLDGPPDVHDRIRGVPGAFRTIEKGLLGLIEQKKKTGNARPSITINTVITNLNAGTLGRLLMTIPLADVDQVTFALMSFCHQELADRHNARWGDKYPASRTCLEGDTDPAGIDVSSLHEELREIEAKHPGKVHFFFENTARFLEKYFHRPDEFMDFRPCLFPWFTAQITASGDLIGVTRCYPRTFGNILERPFPDVWNGAEMRAFRKDLKRHRRFPACTRCEGVLY
jgi:MoaA/NifB/PqqE/SkfB family radical SAM enzyme